MGFAGVELEVGQKYGEDYDEERTEEQRWNILEESQIAKTLVLIADGQIEHTPAC